LAVLEGGCSDRSHFRYSAHNKLITSAVGRFVAKVGRNGLGVGPFVKSCGFDALALALFVTPTPRDAQNGGHATSDETIVMN
jgi:hypothetical protein